MEIQLQKMLTAFPAPGTAVQYSLRSDGGEINLNALIGKEVRLRHLGRIICRNCGINSKKSFGEGYCYRCFTTLAACDGCIVRPETCHHRKGTCREPEWAARHCLIPHTVYIANTSGPKVGVTRSHQRLTRWMDQGAVQALPLVEVAQRWHAGLLEKAFCEYVDDKTNWRRMLLENVEEVDLLSLREELYGLLPDSPEATPLDREEEVRFIYPIESIGAKLSSLQLDKKPEVAGRLTGIKGQYLIFGDSVLNVRSHAGYLVTLES